MVFEKKFEKLHELCDQIFDYFYLSYYDMESKFNNELNIDSITSKFETFADRHFKSAIKDFENELQRLKGHFPKELLKLEIITYQISKQFESLIINTNSFDYEKIRNFKIKIRESLNLINNFK